MLFGQLWYYPPAFQSTTKQFEQFAGEMPRYPGADPLIWCVPFNRNSNFTGRESELKILREQLNSGDSASLTQAIRGLGGMGKTQLALEYIYRHAGDYSLVWWVRCEEQAILASDFADLATPLELPQAEFQEQRLKINAVRQRLGQIFNWLLVFDNAIRPEDLMSYLPQGSSGHVIITVKASPTSFWGWQSPTIFCSLYYTPHKNGAVLNLEY